MGFLSHDPLEVVQDDIKDLKKSERRLSERTDELADAMDGAYRHMKEFGHQMDSLRAAIKQVEHDVAYHEHPDRYPGLSARLQELSARLEFVEALVAELTAGPAEPGGPWPPPPPG